MSLKDLLFTVFILFLLHVHLTRGQNATSKNETAVVTVPSTTNASSTTSCPENDPNCSLNKNEEKSSRGGARRLFFLFLGCLLTTCLVIAMIITYNRVAEQRRHQSSTAGNGNQRFRNILQIVGLNNLRRTSRFPFFSMSSGNNSHSSATHRQGDTSRVHLSENQDEALLFDDPYADGGPSGGLHGSSTNPYKSLTLSVA